jgi:hypothetical protein
VLGAIGTLGAPSGAVKGAFGEDSAICGFFLLRGRTCPICQVL